MAMPSFSEYMKNREEIITVKLFPYEKEEVLGTFERTQLITMSESEASKHNCTITVFDHKNASFINVNNKPVHPGRWAVFASGSESNLKKMFNGKNTVSTRWTQEIEVFAMNGSSFDKKYIVKEFD